MKLLAIDTATTGCSAALFVGGRSRPAAVSRGPARDETRAGGRIVAEHSASMARGQAEALMPMVAEVLAAAACACPNGVADFDLIAVTIGPGAFTGVRIGLAAASAMAAAAGIPAVGLTTLEVVAAAQPATGRPLLVALDAKRADVYCQLFAPSGTPMTAPEAVLPAEIPGRLPPGPLAIAGDGALPVAAALEAAGRDFLHLHGHDRPEASVLARLAADRWRDGAPPAGTPLRPLYLRAPDVSLPRGGA
jgi:tRNA threonylcarbamoyladenosine biosynthesis protein TsaB